ncbi:hypothetical protein CUU64_00550 [Bacillus sp. V5-8f]|nr:hypothetical protein CUU64_00550 [Bacillus sp. V5-8f]
MGSVPRYDNALKRGESLFAVLVKAVRISRPYCITIEEKRVLIKKQQMVINILLSLNNIRWNKLASFYRFVYMRFGFLRFLISLKNVLLKKYIAVYGMMFKINVRKNKNFKVK